MPDQIFAAGPLSAPETYEVPGSQQMVPRAFQALFNGSGASGDYVPTVVLRSQAGHVIARAILDSTVTAGDDAEVSWFPGVKHAAVASTPQDVCIASSAEPYNIPATGGVLNAATTWADFHTSSGTFVSPVGADATKISITKTGLYALYLKPDPVAVWPAPANGAIGFQTSFHTYGAGFESEARFLNTTTTALFASSSSRPFVQTGWVNLPAPDTVQIFASNSTVGNFAMSITNLLIVRVADNLSGAVV